MTETEIRQVLSKIKLINRKFIAEYFNSDNIASGTYLRDYIKNINSQYVSNMKELIGSVNDIRSERILKALGFVREKDMYISTNKEGHYVKSNRWLIPANMLPLIDKGTVLDCIDNTKVVIGKDEIDTYTRNGMIGYYITIERMGK